MLLTFFGALIVRATMTDPHSHDNSSHNLEDILLRLGDTMHTVTLKLDEILHCVSLISPPPPLSLPQTHINQPLHLQHCTK